ncbi:MFS transporter [Paenibacillus sp. B2(2019)]|uniref:MFS transporter n=1 Tax=Paenibacillus sp. B2(2019) TaxID=2607754 RepID=UPI00165FDF1A|nr:MFS transporter [Paenibacillus sp. B2(2019)]
MGNQPAIAIFKAQKGYSRLFTAGLINGIGDRFTSVAVLALVLQLTGSGMAVGISLGVRLLPYLFLAPLGGVLGSKFPRKYIMIAMDVLRVPVALTFLWVDGEDKLWLLYIASFLLAAGEAIYSPVRKSSIPLLVTKDSLLTVNGLEQLMSGCVLILGALSGGVVSMWFGPEAAFVMNAISFMVAALLIFGIDIPQNTNRVNEDKRKIDSPDKLKTKVDRQQKTSKMRALWILISGSITLQVIFGYELLVPMLNGLDNVLISVYAVQEFEAGDIGVGAFYAALGIGLSLSFFAGRYVTKGLLGVAIGGLMIEGLLLMSISVSNQFTMVFMLYILLSFAGGTGNACLDTLVMRETPSAMQPVIFGLLSAVGNTLLGLSMLVAGWLLEWMEPRALGFAGGAGFSVIAILLAGYALIRSKKSGEFTAPWKVF